jgi:hypothetical protein
MLVSKKIFPISNEKGLANRLESYALAFSISQLLGHKVCLQWPEQDVLEIDGIVCKKPNFFQRHFSHRFYKTEDFCKSLANKKWIILKTIGRSHPELLDSYNQAGQHVHLKKEISQQLKTWMNSLSDRPLVGVHLRRGDFHSKDEGSYNLVGAKDALVAVPMGWVLKTMRNIKAAIPDVRFLICTNGDEKFIEQFRKEFDIVTTDQVFQSMEADFLNKYHVCERHPAIDLFSLACCSNVIGQPVSSYTHWSTHVLNKDSSYKNRLIIPPNGLTPEKYGALIPHFEGSTHNDYIQYCMSENQPGEKLVEIEDFSKLAAKVDTAWLR